MAQSTSQSVVGSTADRVPAPALEGARAVADAILYEGYLLYPYRRSSGKNRVRWQFGVLAPRTWIEARGPMDTGVAGSAESWWQQTECLLEPRGHALDPTNGATVCVQLRFLQVQLKSVEARRPDGSYRGVDRIVVDGQLQLSFEEAVPAEFDLVATLADLVAGERCFELTVPGGEDVEPLVERGGDQVAQVRRRRLPLAATVRVSASALETPFRLLRLRVQTANADTSVTPDASRDEALRRSMVATHTLLAVSGEASFVSLLEPPEWASGAAQDCVNVHTFPVLAGQPSGRDLVLSSPIILYDHPQVAPESPGDLHDAAEIDEILSLRTMTLTEEEKREARATDPRSAAIVDRVDTMPPELMARLHGATRSLRPAGAGSDNAAAPESDSESDSESDADSDAVEALMHPAVPWWDPSADASVSPETDDIIIGTSRVARGSRVRLRPRQRGTDAHDMFLEGRTALVQGVFLDVDGTRQLAVTLEDDPGADLHEWYGRFRYFRPEEIEPLDNNAEVLR